MGLYERWTAKSGEEGGSGDKIAVHAFGAAMAETARESVTVAQMITAFNLDATEQAELNAIKQKYVDLSTDVEKAAFMSKFQDVMLLCESGFYSKSKAKAELGF